MSYNGLKKLPTPTTKRTPLILTIHMPIYFMFNKDKQLQIFEGKTPYGISTDKRITRRLLKEHQPIVCKPNPIKTALKYQQLYDKTASIDIVTQQFGITRVRVHQMLNLLKLDQRIINYVINVTEPKEGNFWTERRLRALTKLPKEKQYEKFQSYIK